MAHFASVEDDSSYRTKAEVILDIQSQKVISHIPIKAVSRESVKFEYSIDIITDRDKKTGTAKVTEYLVTVTLPIDRVPSERYMQFIPVSRLQRLEKFVTITPKRICNNRYVG